MNKITPFLWFDDNAEEAMHFYISIFANSKILNVTRRSPDGPVLLVKFELDGQTFMALNGGPLYPFTHAISMFVNCTTQEEVDTLWAKLSEGGEEVQCGWVKDKYGLSWQIVPTVLSELLSGPKSPQVMEAMLKMVKLDIAGLQAAAAE